MFQIIEETEIHQLLHTKSTGSQKCLPKVFRFSNIIVSKPCECEATLAWCQAIARSKGLCTLYADSSDPSSMKGAGLWADEELGMVP